MSTGFWWGIDHSNNEDHVDDNYEGNDDNYELCAPSYWPERTQHKVHGEGQKILGNLR